MHPSLSLFKHMCGPLFTHVHGRFSPEFASSNVESTNFEATWYFGFKSEDNSNQWDPRSGGHTEFVWMDMYKKESQAFYRTFRNVVSEQEWFLNWRHDWFTPFEESMTRECCECPEEYTNCGSHCDLANDCWGDDWCFHFGEGHENCVLTCGEKEGTGKQDCCGHDFGDGGDFPFDEAYFERCLTDWTETNGMGSRRQGLYYDRTGELKGMVRRAKAKAS